jgi:hypothetical protein
VPSCHDVSSRRFKNFKFNLGWFCSCIKYLGHIVSHEGVKVNPNKIKSMREWSIPNRIDRILLQVCQALWSSSITSNNIIK